MQTHRIVLAVLLALAMLVNAYEPHRVQNLSTLRSFAGLVPINNSEAEFFYWFFPSLDGNASAPLVMWLQGGPGCSGMLGLLFEHGPVSLNGVTSNPPMPVLNPYTWANNSHLLYIDNPAGVGFSTGAPVTDMDQMASQLYLFLLGFFALYPQYTNNDFYVFGESYGGKYVPAIGAYIAQQNSDPQAQQIQLKGIAIGNGITDPVTQVLATSFMADFGFLAPVDLQKVNAIAAEVVEAINASDWYTAGQTRLEIYSILAAASGGINVYDCRTFVQYNWTIASEFLNQQEIQALLHVSGTYPGICISYESLENDTAKSTKPQVEALLAGGYKVLLYQGQFDLRDGVASNQAWIPTMTGFSDFDTIPHTIWAVNGTVAGYVRTQGLLTQVVVAGAGHLVALNQPVTSLDMINRFLTGTSFSVKA